jgi:two-component sensor histidine kinase
VPLGLIVNELITNAIQHSRPSSRTRTAFRSNLKLKEAQR